MRWLLLLAMTACAAGNSTLSYRVRTVGTLPQVWASMIAGIAEHQQIATADEHQATVVTKPTRVADLDVMYVVRLEISLPQPDPDPRACETDPERCETMVPLNRVVVTVTPFAMRNNHAVADNEIPRSARDHTSDVLWDIKERWIADQLVDQGRARWLPR